MAENKMADVAKLFGKELGESFEVLKEECGFAYVRFSENGLEMTAFDGSGSVLTRNDIEEAGFSITLNDILTGQAVIIDE